METLPAQPSSFLLIGAGCFGASTALYLKQSNPSAHVTLLDRTPFPCPTAAAHDLNKVIRAEYEDLSYMRLALEAQELWESDPLLKPYYHETGIVFAGIAEPGIKIIENYKSLTGSSPAELLDPDVAQARFGGIFRDADWKKIQKCTWNPRAGWGEAENALRSVIQAAVDLGVQYITATISKISFDASGACLGAQTTDGQVLKAEHTVLCTGAHTAQLIADSAPDRPELQVSGRLVAAAAAMGAFRVPENQMNKFLDAPILINPMGDHPGETIPAGPLGLVKCTHELSFTHNVYHEASKQTISVPPKPPSQRSWSQDVPQGLKDETHVVRKNIYGNWVQGMEPEYYRMCWDAVTPNQDFIISPHPESSSLYIASGGSFHSWKFLANIGKYVTQMLYGELEQGLAKKWAWNRHDEGAACGIYAPTRDLNDIAGYTEDNSEAHEPESWAVGQMPISVK